MLLADEDEADGFSELSESPNTLIEKKLISDEVRRIRKGRMKLLRAPNAAQDSIITLGSQKLGHTNVESNVADLKVEYQRAHIRQTHEAHMKKLREIEHKIKTDLGDT